MGNLVTWKNWRAFDSSKLRYATDDQSVSNEGSVAWDNREESVAVKFLKWPPINSCVKSGNEVVFNEVNIQVVDVLMGVEWSWV